jgi:23S rRNA (uracil1939-C5)-methyltransferase
MIHCPHFNVCSGCTLDAKALEPPIYQKAKVFFESIGFKDVPLIHEELTNWRLKAKVVVRGSSKNPIIGLYKAQSHEAVDIPFCKVHHPLINESIALIKKGLQQLGIEPYDELNHQGQLRYVQLAVNRKMGKVQLSLIVNSMDGALNLINWLQNERSGLWHSFWINRNKTQTNRILGDEWIFVSGNQDFEEEILGQKVYFSPAGFSQANLNLFEKIVHEIFTKIKPNDKVVEFYAGSGTIGLPVAKKASFIKAVEYTKEAKVMFEKANLSNTEYFVGDVKDYTNLIEANDVIIVDPPRKGLDPYLLKTLKDFKGLKTLIYVSCGFDSFARDTKELLEANWRLKLVKTYLLFPGSDHIETLAFFEKR